MLHFVEQWCKDGDAVKAPFPSQPLLFRKTTRLPRLLRFLHTNVARTSSRRTQRARSGIVPHSRLINMSPVTTIQGLKEGNAIEADMIKLLKEGLNNIADGLLHECRKRNAALEDLEEDLGKVGAVCASFRSAR
jgi:hypothetical protein